MLFQIKWSVEVIPFIFYELYRQIELNEPKYKRKALLSLKHYSQYSSENTNWTENRLNGFHIYFSSKEYYY